MADNKKKQTIEEKRLAQSKKRQAINVSAKSRVKTAFKKAGNAIETSGENTAELIRIAVSTIDSTASRGIIHKNKAARKKSRLMKKLNQATA